MIDDLRQRRLIRLEHAADTLGISPKTLRVKLAAHGFSVIDLGPKIRGVRLVDIDALLAASTHQLERAS